MGAAQMIALFLTAISVASVSTAQNEATRSATAAITNPATMTVPVLAGASPKDRELQIQEGMLEVAQSSHRTSFLALIVAIFSLIAAGAAIFVSWRTATLGRNLNKRLSIRADVNQREIALEARKSEERISTEARISQEKMAAESNALQIELSREAGEREKELIKLSERTADIAEREADLLEIQSTACVSAMATFPQSSREVDEKMTPDESKILRKIVVQLRNHSSHLFVYAKIKAKVFVDDKEYPAGRDEAYSGTKIWPLVPSQDPSGWFAIEHVLEMASSNFEERKKKQEEKKGDYEGLFDLYIEASWTDQLGHEGKAPRLWWSFNFRDRGLVYQPTGLDHRYFPEEESRT